MKRFLLFVLVCCLPVCFYGQKQKKAKKQSILCEVVYFSKEKLPDAKQKGTSFGPGMGKGYLYSFEGADIYLLRGEDTLKHKKSDFAGEAFFKKVVPGEYVIIVKGEGFRQDKLKVKVVDKSVKRIATLFPVQ